MADTINQNIDESVDRYPRTPSPEAGRSNTAEACSTQRNIASGANSTHDHSAADHQRLPLLDRVYLKPTPPDAMGKPPIKRGQKPVHDHTRILSKLTFPQQYTRKSTGHQVMTALQPHAVPHLNRCPLMALPS